jgi:hypothetical protein
MLLQLTYENTLKNSKTASIDKKQANINKKKSKKVTFLLENNT